MSAGTSQRRARTRPPTANGDAGGRLARRSPPSADGDRSASLPGHSALMIAGRGGRRRSLRNKTALGADDARRLHRRRRADRDGGGRPGRQRGGAQADREPRHQPACRLPGATTTGGVRGGSGSASTLTVGDAAGDPARGAGGRRGQLSHPADRPGPVRATRTGRPTSRASPPTTRRSRNWQIAAGRAISADDETSAALVAVHRPDGLPPAVRRSRESDRRRHPGQGRAPAGDRRCSRPKARRPSARIRTISS